MILALAERDINVVDKSGNVIQPKKVEASPDEDEMLLTGGDDLILETDDAADDAVEDAAEEVVEEVAAADNLAKSNDPVRIYLRKMGGVALLSREGEVAIAKKIEYEENEILRRLLNLDIGINNIIETAQRFVNGEARVKTFIKVLMTMKPL